ncbi:hypothetical protein G9A89_017856 [Geosiphon pyriformis]|nr:hypothetical protein G9A89_017856 [Geosiphon pyriformis]
MKSLRIFVFYILLFTFATLQSKANSIAAPDPYKSDVTYPTKSELDYPNFIDSVSPDQIAWNQIDSAGNWDTDLSAEDDQDITDVRVIDGEEDMEADMVTVDTEEKEESEEEEMTLRMTSSN